MAPSTKNLCTCGCNKLVTPLTEKAHLLSSNLKMPAARPKKKARDKIRYAIHTHLRIQLTYALNSN